MRALLLLLLAAPLLAACGDDEPATSRGASSASSAAAGGAGAGGPGAGGGGTGGVPLCGSGNRALPDGLTEIVWDDGQADSSVSQENFAIEVDGTSYVLAENPIHEAVRFDLDHPARVHGFSIQWAGLPADGDGKTELEAGLYRDFGHNGFDFLAPEPYWSGTRCLEDAADGQWLTYVLDEPIELTHPGLVYVAHHVVPGAPVFSFDAGAQGDGTCAVWDDCHSSFNLPEAEAASYYNGVSFPFQYDFLVRLHVEYTEQVAPADKVFAAQTFTPKSHVSFGDYDNDGWDDLITDGPTLWHNAGDGTFVDATATSGIAALGISATGGVFGDYDNDGCLDLFLYAEAYTVPDTLLRSGCDGTFTDATAGSGIVDYQTLNTCGDPVNNVRAPSAAAAFLDVDADGLLDLYVANFICWASYTYYVDTVWHNLGGGLFEDWTAQHGFSPKATASRGASPIDHDGDGDVDLFVNNYVLQANLFFDNLGDGTVAEKAIAKGVAGHKDGVYYGHTIGAAWGDLDNDGDFDLVSANLAHPRFFDFSDKTEVLLQDGGTFTDLAGAWAEPVSAAGLRYQETHSVPALADFDLDGVLDLVLTAVYDGRPTDFYWGNGDGTFQLDAYRAGITTENGWGVSVSDFDNDGDPDVFAHVPFVNTNGPRAGAHWLEVRVVGNVAANWAALGSTVRVQAGGETRMRHVQGGSGKGGQDSLYLHFGLADAASVDEISVTFPGGKEVVYAGPHAVDQRIWVYEDGTMFVGWAP